MKKILSVILALALIITAVPMTIAFADGGSGVFITTGGKTYQVQQGDTVTYVYYLNIGEKMTAVDGTLSYNADALSMTVPEDEDGEPYIYGIFPILDGAAVVNDSDPANIHYNFSNPMGKPFNKETSMLIKAQFTVTASSGTYSIDNSLVTLSGIGGTKYIEGGAVNVEPQRMESLLLGLSPYDPDATEPATDLPTEQPTEKPVVTPTDQPTEQPTSATPGGEVTLTAAGVSYTVHQGDVFEYVYCLNIGEKLCAVDGDLYYSEDGLRLIVPLDDDGEEDITGIFPKLKGAAVVNADTPGRVKYNYSNATGKKFDSDTSELIRARFTVTASSGAVSISNTLLSVAGPNEDIFLKNGVQYSNT